MINAANISFAVKGIAVCALTLMAGCADMDRGFSDRDLERFVAVMIAAGCTVTEKNAGEVEQAAGFSKKKLTAITAYLRAKHLMALTKDYAGMTLINEGCP